MLMYEAVLRWEVTRSMEGPKGGRRMEEQDIS